MGPQLLLISCSLELPPSSQPSFKHSLIVRFLLTALSVKKKKCGIFYPSHQFASFSFIKWQFPEGECKTSEEWTVSIHFSFSEVFKNNLLVLVAVAYVPREQRHSWNNCCTHTYNYCTNDVWHQYHPSSLIAKTQSKVSGLAIARAFI